LAAPIGKLNMVSRIERLTLNPTWRTAHHLREDKLPTIH
jgi:hypothetical protein